MSSARQRLAERASNHQTLTILIGWAMIGALLPVVIQLPPFSTFQTSSSWVDGFANAGGFILLAMGLNIVVGLAGLLDLGYAAFFAIGSYTYGMLASQQLIGSPIHHALHVPFWIALVLGTFIAAGAGALLGAPTLRLRGDYLAIVTLGFGEIVPIVLRNAVNAFHDVLPGNAERLAADIPQRDVDRRYGQGRHPAGATRRRRGAKLGRYLLGTQRVFALDKFAKRLKRRFQRAHDLAAERGNANAFDAVIGQDPNREEFAQHAGHRRRADQGLFQRKPDEIDRDLLNFHRVLDCQSTRNLSRTA